jgi:hypothetical protein
LGDTEELVEELSINQGGVYAVTGKGLTHYGSPSFEDRPVIPVPALQPLANPNGLQLAILTLTIVMAGLVLVGRVEWLLRRVAA